MKNHKDKKFAGFLEDVMIYDHCKDYWRAIISDEAQKREQHGWKEWVYPESEERDGNPIESGKNTLIGRGFRISQTEEVGDIEIDAYLKVYDDGFYDHTIFPDAELFICLVLTMKSEKITRLLLQKWFDPETTFSEMEDYIDELIVYDEEE